VIKPGLIGALLRAKVVLACEGQLLFGFCSLFGDVGEFLR
jgi:hypothetical protein